MNVIFVMMDTLRADHLGCYGNEWIKTPRFDAFAKESAVFDQFFADIHRLTVHTRIIPVNLSFLNNRLNNILLDHPSTASPHQCDKPNTEITLLNQNTQCLIETQ